MFFWHLLSMLLYSYFELIAFLVLLSPNCFGDMVLVVFLLLLIYISIYI